MGVLRGRRISYGPPNGVRVDTVAADVQPGQAATEAVRCGPAGLPFVPGSCDGPPFHRRRSIIAARSGWPVPSTFRWKVNEAPRSPVAVRERRRMENESQRSLADVCPSTANEHRRVSADPIRGRLLEGSPGRTTGALSMTLRRKWKRGRFGEEGVPASPSPGSGSPGLRGSRPPGLPGSQASQGRPGRCVPLPGATDRLQSA